MDRNTEKKGYGYSRYGGNASTQASASTSSSSSADVHVFVVSQARYWKVYEGVIDASMSGKSCIGVHVLFKVQALLSVYRDEFV